MNSVYKWPFKTALVLQHGPPTSSQSLPNSYSRPLFGAKEGKTLPALLEVTKAFFKPREDYFDLG